MFRRSTSAILGALALFLALHATPAAAQSLWIPRDRDHAVMLEFLRPNQEGIDGDLFSGAAFLSGRFSVSPFAAIVVELPFAREKGKLRYPVLLPDYAYYPTGATSGTVGNVYVGVESKPHSIPVFWELGVRLPLAPDVSKNRPARIAGSFADVTRSDAFVPRVVVVLATFNVGELAPSEIEYRLRLSPLLDIPTGDRYEEKIDAYMHYAWQIGYHGSQARVGTAISGRAHLIHNYGNLGRTSVNQLELHADFLPGSIRPGLDLRLPLGSGGDSVSVVLGASISGSW